MSANDSATWHPDEPGAALYLERTNFASLALTGPALGVHLVLFLEVLQMSLSRKGGRKIKWGIVAYTSTLFVLAAAYFAASAVWAQDMWIEDRNYPGGPVAFSIEVYWIPVSVFSQCMYILANFLADGLVLYRCWIIWNRSWIIIGFPFLVFLGSTAVSCVSVYQITKQGQEFFTHIAIQFTLPYFSMSMGLNILLTLMIATRLMIAKARLEAVLGKTQSRIYTGITAMLVESAALYSAFSIMFIVSYAIGDAFFNIPLALQSQIMCISPLLILRRVAKGHAYSDSIYTTTQDMAFHNSAGISDSSPNATKTVLGSSGARDQSSVRKEGSEEQLSAAV